jgi:hypothetical protein
MISGTTFGPDRDSCIMRVAELLKDPSICNNIATTDVLGIYESTFTRDMCLDKAQPKATSPRDMKTCSGAFAFIILLAALFARG